MPTKKPHKPLPLNADRRRYARTDRNLAIKLGDKNADFVTETKNISCIGAYCQVDGYIPLLTKLKIALLLPKATGRKTASSSINCEGTVVRVEKSNDPMESNRYYIAVYFNRISKSDMKLIDAYVESHLSSTAPSKDTAL